MSPLAAIIITVYNKEKFLRDCLESAVNQNTGFPYVVIVSEDKGSDSSAEIIEEYAEKYPSDKGKRVSVADCSPNRHLGLVPNSFWCLYAALKMGVKYLSFLDCDDMIADKNKIADQVAFLEKHPEYQIVFSGSFFIGRGGDYKMALKTAKQINSYSGKLFKANVPENEPRFVDSRLNVRSFIGTNNKVTAGAALFRSEHIGDMLRLYDNPQTLVTQDLEVWLFLLFYGRAAIENRMTFASRALIESASRSGDIAKIEAFQYGSMEIRKMFIDEMSKSPEGAFLKKYSKQPHLLYLKKMTRAYAKYCPEEFFQYAKGALKTNASLLFTRDFARALAIYVKNRRHGNKNTRGRSR